eukprot:scaffold1086_cov397-Prasinococcus_capsulatus_cf.AAC.14
MCVRFPDVDGGAHDRDRSTRAHAYHVFENPDFGSVAVRPAQPLARAPSSRVCGWRCSSPRRPAS